MTEQKTILGIDPGTRILGFGVVSVTGRKPKLKELGVINLKKEETHFLVLQRILLEVSRLVRKYKPDEMAIEAPFFGKNPQTMLKLGRAQGAAIAAALLKDIPIYEYAPRSVKLAVTGKGSASKEQVSAMVQSILSFKCDVKYLDATDAVAIALCHFYTKGTLTSAAEEEDIRLKLSSSSSLKGSALSRRVGKAGLENIKSSSHKSSWSDFVKSNPSRTIRSVKSGKENQQK
ncbi:MAG: crossover junction endodeoxyribonuclease RuvC [Bacteroidales bacterium]|nr:crossover junction endodeoxyribonuclease RuvC [Bacteroidales bacterium]MBQ1882529.1 crossover junction endodeoxyribonuclease RuvC [Bacteroidales bacterium]MBQ2483602.1 crossover junction endodeoxyribonuclease RuvC [Bacteroidales bacterium]MBQ2493377.1 crossover junction endodeoxyribonuclease RuvC [Bacteroidales bacterium]MBQ4197721.1 crossover junction endodeoxyribonuclease RuvC [Bacteroidales bacterium]